MRSAKILIASLALLTIAGCDSNGRVSVPLDNVNSGSANSNNPYSSDPMDPQMNPHYMHSHK